MRTSVIIATVLVAAISDNAQAQQIAARQDTVAGSDKVEEIVVTARKRVEALSDVPVTITAFSANQLEARGIDTLKDVAALAPGLNFSKQGNQRGGRSESVVRFRGMDINDVAPTRQLASVFVDGVYVSGGLSSLSFEDVERVEIIKGPQSAYFGRSVCPLSGHLAQLAA